MADDTFTDDRPRPRTACEVAGHCSREPGHGVHRTQRLLVVGSPWGWRAGVVRGAWLEPDGHVVLVHCTEADHEVTVRHHVPLPVRAGDVVALHEGGRLLEHEGRWRSVVVVRGGLGAVPTPADPSRWPRRRDGEPDSPAAYIPG